MFHYQFNKEHNWGLTPWLNNIIVKPSASGAKHLFSCAQAKKFYVLGLSIVNKTSYIHTWWVSQAESIFVYPSDYLGQYHHNTISMLVNMKVLA